MIKKQKNKKKFYVHVTAHRGKFPYDETNQMQ
jgi:hypothetical protein